MRPTRFLSTLHCLLVAAAWTAAFDGLSVAAASRQDANSVLQWCHFDPAHGTTSLSGDVKTIVRLSRAWRREGGELLWFRSAGREYVVRDPEVLGRVRAIMKDQRGLDPEEAAVEKRMKAVERREARLERNEERMEEDLERIEAERDEIHDRRSRSRSDGSRERDRQRLSQLEDTAAAIRESLAALRAQRRAIDDEMAEANRQEQALERRQNVLEKRSDAAMERLCFEALRAGRAQPAPR